jgi:rsbT co-antagonist protein RsbR
MPRGQRESEASRLQFTDQEIERRKKAVDLREDDIIRIRSCRDTVTQHADELGAGFFDYLRKLEGTQQLFAKPDLLAEARRLKHQHLLALAGGSYGKDYAEQRVLLALIYGRAGIEVPVFLGAFHQLMRQVGLLIMKQGSSDPTEAFQRFMSVKKVGFLDIGIFVDVLVSERERIIAVQQDAIRELSTPVLQVRDRLLILPVIGVIDTQRAKQLTEGLLHAIRANRAKVAVMDITGVGAIDSKVANHLIQTIAAARLMGATVIVTGLSADVAQALVSLGIDLGKVNTVADLQGGLEEAERVLGYEVVPAKRLLAEKD